MALQKSVAVRNAELDSIETTIGVSARVLIFSGAQPANCAAADPAGLLATLVLPSDYFNNASAGTKTLLGSWTVAASGTGTALSWRMKDSTLATCHLQGTCGLSAADMILDNTNIVAAQVVTVTAFTITAGNA